MNHHPRSYRYRYRKSAPTPLPIYRRWTFLRSSPSLARDTIKGSANAVVLRRNQSTTNGKDPTTPATIFNMAELTSDHMLGEAMLFDPVMQQSYLVKEFNADFKPVSAINPGSPIEFSVPKSEKNYLDLNNSWMVVTVQVVKRRTAPRLELRMQLKLARRTSYSTPSSKMCLFNSAPRHCPVQTTCIRTVPIWRL